MRAARGAVQCPTASRETCNACRALVINGARKVDGDL
ncbi:MAG: hypothetical protein E6G85_13005 [Alphaproteobacteria bacterium]|nr:MAG: hypothetical protein E6G85_13005 [Alphaproteobacteria bacterium]